VRRLPPCREGGKGGSEVEVKGKSSPGGRKIESYSGKEKKGGREASKKKQKAAVSQKSKSWEKGGSIIGKARSEGKNLAQMARERSTKSTREGKCHRLPKVQESCKRSFLYGQIFQKRALQMLPKALGITSKETAGRELSLSSKGVFS